MLRRASLEGAVFQAHGHCRSVTCRYGARGGIGITKPTKTETRSRHVYAVSRCISQDLYHNLIRIGPNGTESAAWARAAGMQNFDTFRGRCATALTSPGFSWPEGVVSVDYGFGGPVQKPG